MITCFVGYYLLFDYVYMSTYCDGWVEVVLFGAEGQNTRSGPDRL